MCHLTFPPRTVIIMTIARQALFNNLYYVILLLLSFNLNICIIIVLFNPLVLFFYLFIIIIKVIFIFKVMCASLRIIYAMKILIS